MNTTLVKTFKKLDTKITMIEKYFAGFGLLIITALVLLGVILRTIFDFSFNWLEEMCQYIMVWIVCIGCVLSVKNNEHVGVDVIFSIIPKKFHTAYNTFLAVICVIFLLFFNKYSIDLLLKVYNTGQRSIAMSWFQMYFLYLGFVIGNVLLLYEYIKSLINLLNKLFKREKAEGIS